MNAKCLVVVFSHQVVFNSLRHHRLQHTLTISRSLPKFMSTESVMPSNHLILCYSLLLLPAIFPSIRVFSNESSLCIRWPKYQSFSFSISPSREYSGLNSFRIDWFDLLAVQETLKSLLCAWCTHGQCQWSMRVKLRDEAAAIIFFFF